MFHFGRIDDSKTIKLCHSREARTVLPNGYYVNSCNDIITKVYFEENDSGGKNIGDNELSE